jgi:hypothetical protein
MDPGRDKPPPSSGLAGCRPSTRPSRPQTMLTVLTQTPAFVSSNRSLATCTGGAQPQGPRQFVVPALAHPSRGLFSMALPRSASRRGQVSGTMPPWPLGNGQGIA